MRQTITNIFMLLVVPLTLLPIVLGASAELENQRKEHYWRMRREHLRSMARDRHRRAERLRKQAEERRNRIRIAEKP